MRRKELLTLLDEYILENFFCDEVVDEIFPDFQGFMAEKKSSKPKPETFYSTRQRHELRYESSPRMLNFMVPAFLRDDIDKNLEEKSDETFSEMLVRLVEESGKKPSEIYKRADVDRQIYSRIKNNRDYRPSKDLIVAFALALKLDFPTTKKLLETAGFALSKAVKRDIIISFFFEKGIFSVRKLNDILYEYEQDTLFKRD